MTERRPLPARGRKRSAESRLAILSAAYDLTTEVGYRDLTIEAIAARAGAGKQTVYKWWPSKADVLLEALAQQADLAVSTTGLGSFSAEVHRFLQDSAALAAVPGVVRVLRALMSEAQRDDAFRHRFQEGFLLRRRAAFEGIVERASARGDKPDRLTPGVAADLVFGTVWYRFLATERTFDADDAAVLEHLLVNFPSGDDP